MIILSILALLIGAYFVFRLRKKRIERETNHCFMCDVHLVDLESLIGEFPVSSVSSGVNESNGIKDVVLIRNLESDDSDAPSQDAFLISCTSHEASEQLQKLASPYLATREKK